MIKQEDVTIIIPHLGLNNESIYALKECVNSLLETCDIKILLAFNGPWHDTVIADERISTIYVKQQGQCKAVNAAVATVNTPWIFVTNDDMVYAPRWFEKLTGWLEGVTEPGGKEIMCVSPMLVEPRKGATTFKEYFCGGAGGDFDKQKWLDFVKEYFKDPDWDYPWRTGFNLPFLVKKELWDTVGGYDINYDPWGSNSDSDLEYKIKLAGVQPYQNTNCIVYHFSQTSGTFHPDNNEYYQRNFVYFKEKWGFDRTDEGIWEANFKIPETPERKFRPDWEAAYGEVN